MWLSEHDAAHKHILCAELLRLRGAHHAALALVSPTPSIAENVGGSAGFVVRVLLDLGRRVEARAVFDGVDWERTSNFALTGMDRDTIAELLRD